MLINSAYVESKKLMRGVNLIRRFRSRLIYPLLTKLMRRCLPAPTKFLNYGYAPLPNDPAFTAPVLSPEEETDRLFIQLYHRIAHVHVRDRAVLEVSCGHGGGAEYMARYLQPRSIVGVDWNPEAINFCRGRYATIPNLSFQVGDAEHLPIADQTVDVVVNVEASHCYGSMSRFLREVRRVLRPDGYLLFADLRSPAEQVELEGLFTDTGFQRRAQHDLTPNVVAALQQDEERKWGLFEKGPRWLHGILAEFARAEGSQGYWALANRAKLYLSYTLQCA
jgi:ubiquinone/menaquinone biosynthesis C-methylase UbiE